MKDEIDGSRRFGNSDDLVRARITKLFAALPKTTGAQVLGKQLQRSGTSVGAHLPGGKTREVNPRFR
jgi:hypothetical protein